MDQPTVADVGELGLLARLQPFCATDVMGDDAAVLPETMGEKAPVMTTDVLVEGVHFSDRTTSAEDVGWRAIAANLSDLAAMGATPIGVTVGLSLPGTMAVDWVEAVYRGMAACLQTYGGQILGGDVCRATQTSLAITALGQVVPPRVIRRNRSQPGQVIVATGYHGASRAGLELLLQPEVGAGLGATERANFIRVHQRPCPRLDVVAALGVWEDQAFASLAGMDTSDGLANAVLHLCQASGVGARLMRSQLPIPPGLSLWLGAPRAQDWCLYGGEDFELVLCLPRAAAEVLVSQLGPGAAIIGTIQAEPTVVLVDDGDTVNHNDAGSELLLTWEGCFQHF